MNPLVRNTAQLLTANVLAQAIGLLVYPILTRMYSPAAFGELNVFLSWAGILTLLSTVELQYAIVLPREDEKALRVFLAGMVCLVTVSLATVLISIPVRLPLLAPFVFLSGLWTLLNYYLTRQQRFGLISGYQMTQSLSGALLKILFGWLALSSGLIFATTAAPLIGLLLILLLYAKPYNLLTSKPHNLLTSKPQNLLEVVREYRNFPLYSLPRALTNNLGNNLPAIILAPLFGLTQLGFFSMAITLAFRPINIVSTSVYQVLFQRTTELVNQRQSIRRLVLGFVGKTLAVVLPCFALLYFVLPPLCEWLLGTGWEQSGIYIRWMLPWLLLSSMVAPICYLADIFQQQKIGLFFEVLLLLARMVGMLLGIWQHRFLWAVAGYSLLSAVVIFLQLLWYLSLVRRYERTLA